MTQLSLTKLKSLIEEILEDADSSRLYSLICSVLDKKLPKDEMWQIVSQNFLKASWPLKLHKLIFQFIYTDWDEAKLGPPPIWSPTKEYIENSDTTKFLKANGYVNYDDFYKWTIEHEPDYVEHSVKKIKFDNYFSKILVETDDISKPKWLYDASLNIYNTIFDTSHQNKPALIICKDSVNIERISFSELKELTDSAAASMCALGVVSGDNVAICANYTLEAIAVFFAAIRCGCIISCILNNISANEIKNRLDILPAKLVFVDDLNLSQETESTYAKFKDIHTNKLIVMSNNPSIIDNNAISWDTFLNLINSHVNNPFSYAVAAPLFICFSSGTTAEPKGVVITHEMVLANAGYTIPENQISYWPTSLGWILGTITLFSTTINHSPLALFYPGPKHHNFSKFIAKASISRFGTYPRIQKFWRENDSLNPNDLKDILYIFSSGESGNYDDQFDLIRRTGYKPFLESCGATELGKSYLYSIPIRSISIGYLNAKVPGRDIVFKNKDPNKSTDISEAFIKANHFGITRDVLNYCHDEIYFQSLSKDVKILDKRLRSIGDLIQKLPGRFYKILGRVGDTLNIGGALYHPISIEQNVNKLDFVIDSSAIGIFSNLERMILIIFVILRKTKQGPQNLKEYLQSHLRRELDSNLILHDVVEVDELPYTSTGKIKRRDLKEVYLKKNFQYLTL